MANGTTPVTMRLSRSALDLVNDIKPRHTSLSEIVRKLCVLYITSPEVRDLVQAESKQTAEEIANS